MDKEAARMIQLVRQKGIQVAQGTQRGGLRTSGRMPFWSYEGQASNQEWK